MAIIQLAWLCVAFPLLRVAFSHPAISVPVVAKNN